MLKEMPRWYANFAFWTFAGGLMGILPAMVIEICIWKIANGKIVMWDIVATFAPLFFSIIFKDFRDKMLKQNTM